MKTLIPCLIVVICIVVVDYAFAHARKCSNQTLKGTYRMQLNGYLPGTLFTPPDVPVSVSPFPFPLVDARPFNSLETITFDGQGTFEGLAKESVGGFIEKDIRTSGQYQINPDCTGTLEMFRDHDDDLFRPDVLELIEQGTADVIVHPNGKSYLWLSTNQNGLSQVRGGGRRLWN